MQFPSVPSLPRVDLPNHLVVSLDALAALWAAANVALGFVYLLYGLRVFRVMTTLTAALWGAAIGMVYAQLIDSVTVAMIFGALSLGSATWFYTRWMVAAPMAVGAAAFAWQTSHLNGADPLTSFFISLAAAVAVGGPVIVFYRTVVIGLTCVQGATLVVIGAAAGILLVQHKPIALLQDDLQPGMHLVLAGVCVLLLALPAFYLQTSRLSGDGESESTDEAAPAKETPARRKAA